MKQAFTLIELLVVISIIAALAAILTPSLVLVRESAAKLVCAGRIKQIGVMVHLYAAENEGLMAPPLVGGSLNLPEWNYPYTITYPSTFLLGKYDTYPWTSPYAGTVTPNGRDTVFHCPRDPRRNPSKPNLSYGMNMKLVPCITTSWSTQAARLSAINRQSDKVLMIDAGESRWEVGSGGQPPVYMIQAAELVAETGNWGGGPNSNFNWTNWHRMGANMLFVDGHVRFSMNPSAESATGLALFR